MDTWESLKRDCAGCRGCSLAETRHNLVFGVGNAQAEVMLIGEGPGEQEDLQGIPFVGPAGKLLDDMLEMIDLDRQKVYIANIVKCRPPRNRDPLNVEQEACRPWLDRQMALVNPKIIVCLGRIAAMALIREDFPHARFILEPTSALCSYYAEVGGYIVGFEGNFNAHNDNSKF